MVTDNREGQQITTNVTYPSQSKPPSIYLLTFHNMLNTIPNNLYKESPAQQITDSTIDQLEAVLYNHKAYEAYQTELGQLDEYLANVKQHEDVNQFRQVLDHVIVNHAKTA